MFTLSRKVSLSFFTLAMLMLMMLVMAATSVDAHASTLQTSNASYKFKTLNDNADPTFNQLLGINNNGVIAGYFGSGTTAAHPNKGYTLNPPYKQHNYKNENFPGSVQTQVTAINNKGYTAGFWVDANGNNFGFVEWHGVFTSYRDPNTGTGTVNQLLGLNDNGIAVGFYTDGQGINHGYKLTLSNGHFTELVPPGGKNVTATGINDNGDIVGFFTASNGSVVSFLHISKTYSEFDFPHSTNTSALGVNQYDQIVGVYVDNAKQMHGFLLSSPLHHAKWQSIDDPNGVGTTTVNGLNDKGQLVGFYVDGAGNTDGFLAQ